MIDLFLTLLSVIDWFLTVVNEELQRVDRLALRSSCVGSAKRRLGMWVL